MFNQLIILCRAGFEKECATEILRLTQALQLGAYIQAKPQSAYISLITTTHISTSEIFSHIQFNQLIFSRQWFVCHKTKLQLPEKNRLPDIISTIKTFKKTFYDVEMSYADTNEGKTLSKFCKQFKPHLLTTLKKNKLLNTQTKWRLHLFFTDSQNVNLGISPIENSAQVAMGLARLKMPKSAPSRSTLKLDEAIQWFLTQTQQKQLFKNGLTAVDLGAAPGGWSWQLIQRGCMVTAIDNGAINKDLLKTQQVEHLKTDAFTYKPSYKVNWLVCDMAERPLHVSRLIARWFVEGLCQNAIYNLKLPMKKRIQAVDECLELVTQQLTQANIKHTINAKQLYHDREEVTVCVLTK